MRIRLLTTGAAMALAIGLLTAAPAESAYVVESITFPGGNAEFYSPFSGPASIKFTFDGSESNATFQARLRPTGGTAVHREDLFVTPDEPELFEIEEFDWPALSVNKPKSYEVAVYRNGGLVELQSFFLRPRLVAITDVRPDPFLPWIDDGHKDTAKATFTLAADADAEARVYRPKSDGRCCGALVRSETVGLGTLSEGANDWIWDGRDGNGDNLAKGDYFVRIVATDLAAVTRISKPHEVTIARTYRATAVKSKPARAYHHVGPVTSLVLGGDCLVFVDSGDLRILCQGGRVSVYWRWGLSSDERIERAGFVIGDPAGDCPRSIRRTAHTKHGSSFTVNEDLVGASGDCRLVTAKITYSYPKQS